MKTLKTSLILLILVGIFGNTQAQDYLISFALLGENGTPDSVLVENQNQSTTIMLNGNDVLHLVDNIIGVSSDISFNQLLKISPNPIRNSGILTFYNPKNENVHIGIYNAAGHLITQKTGMLPQGTHFYKLGGVGMGTYIVAVSTNSNKRSVVLISTVAGQSEPSIVHVNSNYTRDYGEEKTTVDATKNAVEMQYNDGENLKFTAFLNNFISTEELVPTSSQIVNFNFLAPIAAFSVDVATIAEGETVTFTDQSLNNPVSWSWNFGDGSSSTEANPLHTYNSAGTYTVELMVSNDYGFDTETKINYITVESGGNSITDIDGNVYATIQIGEQKWMVVNLKTTKYNDGTFIELIADNAAWENNTTGAYCWLNNDEPQYGETNGALYNWNAVNRGNLCPNGWHVPTNDEWTVLKNYVAADGHSGNEGTALRATFGWPNGGNGTDDYGFTALPGDMRFDNGNFSDFDFGYWWSSTEYNPTNAWFIGLYGNYNPIYQSNYSKQSGYSIRCLKDN